MIILGAVLGLHFDIRNSRKLTIVADTEGGDWLGALNRRLFRNLISRLSVELRLSAKCLRPEQSERSDVF
jgi:hypothetical protein